METLTLDTNILHYDAGTPNDLAGVSLPVDLAQSSPGTEDLCISDLDQADVVLGAKGLNELDVLRLRTSLD